MLNPKFDDDHAFLLFILFAIVALNSVIGRVLCLLVR